jgi:hypothetical protein
VLHKERDRVQRVIDVGKALPLDNAEAIGHWGRYACITCTGYIEVALRLVIQEHVRTRATREIAAYVIRDLEGVQNPKAEKIVKVMRCFSDVWGEAVEQFFAANPEVKDAIDSLMANRHLIAHGRPCTISLGRVATFYADADKAISFIDGLLNPLPAAD